MEPGVVRIVSQYLSFLHGEFNLLWTIYLQQKQKYLKNRGVKTTFLLSKFYKNQTNNLVQLHWNRFRAGMNAVHHSLEVSSQLNFLLYCVKLLHMIAIASSYFYSQGMQWLPFISQIAHLWLSSSAIFGCLSLPRCEYRRRRGNTWGEESKQLALNKTRHLFSWGLKDACAAALCVGLRRHYTNKGVLNMKERLAFKAGLLTAAVCCVFSVTGG